MEKVQNKYWLLVVVAACFEVVWVMGLKHADTVLFWTVTVAAIIVSFWLLIYTAKKLPTSTAYAVFVGLGTVGTVIVEMTVFGVPFSWAKVILVAVLLTGIIGLKTVTHGNPDSSAEQGKRGDHA
ncbi:multidrug efflux SMR transporter [Paenibacillus sp. GSMTC-2017]|uniref:DMT family transporter n=1 Tax=Paenibacillus sp. GSMTC-2017 TaxID=2794350 RepID=UPI0018D85C8E|nr:multidrug efflux SMR transporter [Paenibacillus sp. GSMTC-2017]MBH5317720.1 multidrug efflux SMR transporter [Paenibacillus sp. GSMTC-2017]